jgi:hypothetical protein
MKVTDFDETNQFVKREQRGYSIAVNESWRLFGYICVLLTIEQFRQRYQLILFVFIFFRIKALAELL